MTSATKGAGPAGAPSSPIERTIALIETVVDRIGALSAVTCLVLVLVMATNVLLRYLFATGSIWAQELEWHLLVPICMLGAAYALRHGEHIRVDVLYAHYPERLKAFADLVTAIVALLVSGLILKLSLPYVLQSWTMNEGSANPGGVEMRYILKAFIPFGFALYFLQSAADALKAWLRLFPR